MTLKIIKEYHHFKKNLINDKDRLSKCERFVSDLLLESKLSDKKRESSICWELKHQSNCAQFAKILARKRNLQEDICAIGLLFHDIYSIVYGSYKDHAHLGAPIALEMIKKLGDFTREELDKIQKIIYHHSDKHIWSEDPYEEIGKDADILDTFLYDGAFDYYLAHKPIYIFKEYLKRIKKVWSELKIKLDPKFDLLDRLKANWFKKTKSFNKDQIKDFLNYLFYFDENILEPRKIPPFVILAKSNYCQMYSEEERWTNIFNDFNKSSKIRDSRGLKEIFNKIDQATENNVCSLVFWPLIGIYEVIDSTKMKKRLAELGIKE